MFVGVDVDEREPADRGGRLGVEQHEQAGDAVLRSDVVIVQQPAGVGPLTDFCFIRISLPRCPLGASRPCRLEEDKLYLRAVRLNAVIIWYRGTFRTPAMADLMVRRPESLAVVSCRVAGS